jgi:hypothetical protein
MVIALEHAGDERRLLILPHGEELRIAAEARRDRGPTARCVGDALRLARLAPTLCNSNSGERDPGRCLGPESLFAGRIVRRQLPRSILCLPLVKQAKLMGVL